MGHQHQITLRIEWGETEPARLLALDITLRLRAKPLHSLALPSETPETRP